jgi:hypothetical protein
MKNISAPMRDYQVDCSMNSRAFVKESTGHFPSRSSCSRSECPRKKLLQRRSEGEGPSAVPAIVHDVLNSPGQPLDSETRAFFEPRFGHNFGRMQVHSVAPQASTSDLRVGPPDDSYEKEADQVADRIMKMPQFDEPNGSEEAGFDFSRVRLHTDARAAQSARGIGARAFTIGQDIVFGTGQYQPVTTAGLSLLAHELAHIAQQRGSSIVQRKIGVGAGISLDNYFLNNNITDVNRTRDIYAQDSPENACYFNEILVRMLSSSRNFKVAGSNSAQAEANLRTHVGAREGIIRFASQRKYHFGVADQIKMNPKYWDVRIDPSNPKKAGSIRSDVDPEEAIKDLNVNPDEYYISCYMAAKLTMLGGSGDPNLKDDNNIEDSDWIPGDWGYIENTKYNENPNLGQEGENIIYVGNGLFWGHTSDPDPYNTKDGWLAIVRSWSGAAEFWKKRTRPTLGLID